MGTCMYVHVEQRQGKQWKFVSPPSGEPETLYEDWYRSQCYSTMSVLSDVRNYDEIVPIHDTMRMLPCDRSNRMVELWDDMDDLRITWLLLSEIKSYDFDQTVMLWTREVQLDGKVVVDVCSNRSSFYRNGRLVSREESGYKLNPVPVRDLVGDLLCMLERIESSLPGVPPEDIRLTLFFSL